MDKEKIDEIFEAFENNDIKTFLRIAEIGIEYSEYVSSNRNKKRQLIISMFRGIFAKIDGENFEYLKSKIRSSDKIDSRAWINWIIACSEEFNDYIVELISGKEQLDIPLESNEIMEIILQRNMKDGPFSSHFIKDCLDGKINLALVLDAKDVKKLLDFVHNDEGLPDREFIIKILKQRDDVLCEFAPREIEVLHDSSLIETYVGKMKDDERFIENPDELISLIKGTKNKDFIRKAIDGTLGIKVSERDAFWLIIDDIDLIKEVIEGKIHLEVELKKETKTALILATDDLEYIAECIRNNQKLGISVYNLIKSSLKLPNVEQYAEEWLKDWKRFYLDGEIVLKLIKLANNEITHQIDLDKLEELLLMKDASYLRKFLLDDILLKNDEQGNIDIEAINSAIEKNYDLFLTNTLPDNFKLFYFFRYHWNYNSSNPHFYEDTKLNSRDKMIFGDLFKTILESDNIQMRNFLELLLNGNAALNQDSLNDDLSKAILLKYRDTIFGLAKITQDANLPKTEDYIKDLNSIKQYFNLDLKDDIGAFLLERYIEDVGLQYGEEGKSVIESLLEIMGTKKQEAHERNQRPFQLCEGDVIKGMDGWHLEEILKNGIRSKEFFAKGKMASDSTPLDTDFSEITKENIQHDSLEQIIDSTISKNYGGVFLVIKKEMYEGEESYTYGSGNHKTRYFRTGIGSTRISAILSKYWENEYKFILAQNGFYIPVIDISDGKVLFTLEDYEQIRQSMQGLSHFGIPEYNLEESVYDADIREKAEELRKNNEGRKSTEEKRNALIDFIRKNIGRDITTEMIGDISSRYLELIDIGSTGRGTNIPGDDDFNFILKYSSKDERRQMREKLQSFFKTEGNRYIYVGDGEIDEPINLKIAEVPKRLETDYTSDLAIRDRLNSIREQYGEDGLKAVIDNIIVAKKLLKECGVYQKRNTHGATKLGGFSEIGIENWILQNGGSFIQAMKTFLENTVDENGKEISFNEFKRRYPIYDFGVNHVLVLNSHAHYIEGVTSEGFEQLKKIFREQLKGREAVTLEDDILGDSIIKFTKRAEGYMFSDMSQIYGLIARLKTHEHSRSQQDGGEINI